MKRPLALLLVLGLLLGLLAGCAAPEEVDDTIDMVAFDQMEYTRPDLDAALQHIEAARAAVKALERAGILKKSKLLKAATAALDVCFDDYDHLDTMETLAMIRSDLDVTNDYYAGEYGWCADADVTLYAALEELMADCAASDAKEALEEHYFGAGYLDAYGEDYVISDELTALRRRENELVTKYFNAMNSAGVTIDGTSYTLDALTNAMDTGTLGISDSEAYERYYSAVNAELGAIYIDLVRTRQALAAQLGYDSYQEMAYDENGYDYDLSEVAAYTAAIRETLAPLYTKAHDSGILRKAYNAPGEQDTDVSLRAVETLATALGGDFADAMEFMKTYDLYGVSKSSLKSPDSYEIYLTDWEAPYLFADSEGYAEDVLTIAHEFGHYTDDFIYYGAYHSTDVSETLSQGMEYLSLCYLPDNDLRGVLTDWKLADVLQLYVEQGSFNAFEEQVYALPDAELTLENVNAIALRTVRDFADESGYGETVDAMSWVTISHFFEAPFYVLSYLTSDSAAIQFYEQELKQEGAGLDLYKQILEDADNYSFTELMEHNGLRNPLSAEQISAIAELMQSQLLQ